MGTGSQSINRDPSVGVASEPAWDGGVEEAAVEPVEELTAGGI